MPRSTRRRRTRCTAAPSIATCRVRETIVQAIASIIDTTTVPMASPV
jgi:hypothetical protein